MVADFGRGELAQSAVRFEAVDYSLEVRLKRGRMFLGLRASKKLSLLGEFPMLFNQFLLSHVPGLLGQVLLQDRLATGGRLPRGGAAEPAAELAGRGGMRCSCKGEVFGG